MIRNTYIFVILLLAGCISLLSASTDIESSTKPRILSRRKRYVAFPEGSSFSCAGCMTVGVLGQPSPTSSPGTFTFGLNWGIAYELPNTTETARFYRRKLKTRKTMEQRRSRRALYDRMETIMDKMGYDGRQCMLKTLCETTQRIVPHGGNMIEEMFRILFTMGYDGRQCMLKTLCETTQRIVPHGGNMIEEMFRILFTLPMTKVLPIEPLEHTIYDAAHRLGTMLENCNSFQCPISLVDLAKGYYNAPAPTVDTGLHPWSLFSSNFG